MSQPMHVWTLFEHPKDAPDFYVLRLFVCTAGCAFPTTSAHFALDPEPLRDLMRRRGLTCITRSPDDEPQIVEVWL
jgi:hypothetical protein